MRDEFFDDYEYLYGDYQDEYLDDEDYYIYDDYDYGDYLKDKYLA